jgi:hypothetical protein
VTNNQVFFAIAGLMVTLFGLAMAFFKYYIDAKVDGSEKRLDAKLDGLAKQVDTLVNYMILHEGKIATLEERTKKP